MPTHSTRHTPSGTVPENYERYFVPAIGRPVAHDLLKVAGLRVGEAVLDVGCGTGVVSRLAAQQVAPKGVVVGLDIHPGMLAVAQSVTPPDLNITWYQASAESMPFPDDSFDAVLCQMSLQFVADRAAAAREIRRVLVPNGRVVLNVPGPAAPIFTAMAAAMGKHIAPEAKGFVDHVFSLHRPSELEELLTVAGFRDIAVLAETKELELPPPKEFLWQYVNGTPLAEVVAEADARSRRALERELVSEWSAFEDRGGGGMECEQPMVIARARK